MKGLDIQQEVVYRAVRFGASQCEWRLSTNVGLHPMQQRAHLSRNRDGRADEQTGCILDSMPCAQMCERPVDRWLSLEALSFACLEAQREIDDSIAERTKTRDDGGGCMKEIDNAH